MKKWIIISLLILIFFSVFIFTYFQNKSKYQKADIYYYSSFENDKVFNETIKISIGLSNSEKLTKMINQVLLGPKNSLEKGSQNKNVRCINTFYLNKIVFVYFDRNFYLLTKNEVIQTLKSIVKTLQDKISSEEKFIKIMIEDFKFVDNKDFGKLNIKNKISFEKILKLN